MTGDALFETVADRHRNLEDILDAVAEFFRRFVTLTESQIIAIALWVVLTYVVEPSRSSRT
jgi:hypothetical protein